MADIKLREKSQLKLKDLPWKQILAVLILLFAFVFFRSERHEMAQIIPALQSADSLWVAVGILVTCAFVSLQALMYMASFRSVGLATGFWESVELFLKRNFLSVFLPAGGISSMAYTPAQLQKRNFSAAQIHKASAVYMFAGLLTVFIVGIPVILYGTGHGGGMQNSWAAVAILGGVLYAFYYIAKSFRVKNAFYRRIAKKFPKLITQADEIFSGTFSQKHFLQAVAVSTVLEFCGIFHAFIAMYALGLHPSFEAAAIGYTVSVLLMIVSPFLRGLGAVELSMIYVFVNYGYSHAQGLAITLLYRVFEFWLPVLFGVLAFVRRGFHLAARIFPAIAIFILGLINLISVIMQPLAYRLKLEKLYLPYEAMHFSKLAVLMSGIILLITSAYLIKGLKVAWYFAVVFSLLSIFGNVFRGLGYEEAAVALITLILLIISKKQYRLQTNQKLLKQGFYVFFIIFLAVFIFNFCSFCFIGRSHFGQEFSVKQAAYYTLRSFAFLDSGLVPRSRFARDFLDINRFLAVFSWAVLLIVIFRPKKFIHLRQENTQRAAEILEKYGDSAVDYFKISPDKKLFFSRLAEGFLAYNVANNFAVVLEQPVCAPEDKAEIIGEFEDFCMKKGLNSAYYRVDESALPFFKNIPKSKLLIGQEAIIDVEKFNLHGKERKSLRNGLNGLSKKGFSAVFSAAPQPEETVRALQKISDDWLRFFNKQEIIFAEEKFDAFSIKNQDIILVADRDGRPVTFLNIIPDFAHSEITYDMVRRAENAPPGSIDSAILKLIETARERGLHFVNLGLTPLAGIEKPDNVAEGIMKFAYQRLGNFHQYQTMRKFKEKYADIWRNKYLLYSNEIELLQLPAVLHKIMKPDAEDQ